jgi:hypothetical protein
MRWIAAALALAAPLAAPAAAQDAKPAPAAEEKPASLDEQYYRAFYLENGLRDFEKAEGTYAGLAGVLARVGKADLQVKCLVGRARCLKVLGRAEESRTVAAEALKIDADNAEAKALAAASSGNGDGTGPESLEKRLRTLAMWLEQSMSTATLRELRMAGDRAVPVLAESLRKRDLQAVEHAAAFLSYHSTPASRAALLAALRDPEVVYAAAVAEQICHPRLNDLYRTFENTELPLLEEIAGRPEVDLRQKVLVRLNNDSSRPDTILPLVVRLAGDPAATIRIQTLQYGWTPAIYRGLEPAIRKSLASEDAEERAAAAAAAGADAALLRRLQAEVRALLEDRSAAVRSMAYESLSTRDGLTQDDLAGLLDDPDGDLAGRAAERLGGSTPWGPATAAAVRNATERALRGEIPAEGIERVMDLIVVHGCAGGFTPDEWLSVFAATWHTGFPWGATATGNLRQRVLSLFEYRMNATGYQDEFDACVLRGVKTIPSAEGVIQWVEFWIAKSGTGAREAWLHAAAYPDTRVRTVAYAAIVQAQRRFDGVSQQWREDPPILTRPVSEVFPHLAEDLASENAKLRANAVPVACLVPDPTLAKDLRALHDRAAGESRARLLEVLVRAAGKASMDVVRGDLASKDPVVRTEALGRLVITLGVEDPAEVRAYMAAGGLPSEVAGLWLQWDPTPSLTLLRAFLQSVPAAGIDEYVLAAAGRLPAGERWLIHSGAFASPTPHTRYVAAERAAGWRVVEAIPRLSEALDDPDEGVRSAAQSALETLRTYIDLKASASRIGKGGDANTFATAEDMLKDASPLKRKGAVLALAALGDKAAIPILLKALDDPDPSVQEAALGALERLGGKPPTQAEKKKD